MERNIQKFTKQLSDYEKAKKYYSLMLELNNMHLGKGELEFLIFLALAPMPLKEAKKQWIMLTEKSMAVVDNIIGKLRKLHLLEGQTINPYAFPDFSKPIFIQITLNGEAV